LKRLVCILALAGFAFSSIGPALAGDKPLPGTFTAVDALIAGINTGDLAKVTSAYTSDAVIVDEFAPFRWDGAQAGANWWKDFGAFAKAAGISNAHITHAKPEFLGYDKEKSSAYVVVPCTFTYTLKGKRQTEMGRWVLLLRKTADAARKTAWKVSLSSWASVSDTGFGP